MLVQWHRDWDDESTNVQVPDIGGCTPTINLTSEIPVDPNGNPWESFEDSPTPDIEIPGATTFEDLSGSDETIVTFTLPIGECRGLLGATMGVTNLENPGEIETMNPKRWTSEQGAVAVVAAQLCPRILE